MITELSQIWALPEGARLQLTFIDGTGNLAGTPTGEQFDAIRAYLDVWAGQAGHFQQEISTMSQQLDALNESIANLQTKVEQNTSVIGSAKDLINGLSTEVHSLSDALAAAILDQTKLPDVQVAVDALATKLDSADADLAAAVAANTPAAPPSDPPPADPIDPGVV